MKYIKRAITYGIATSLIIAPFSYQLGYKKAEADINFQNRQFSHLERLTDETYLTTNPKDHSQYVLDFSKLEIKKHSPNKESLLEIFSLNHRGGK